MDKENAQFNNSNPSPNYFSQDVETRLSESKGLLGSLEPRRTASDGNWKGSLGSRLARRHLIARSKSTQEESVKGEGGRNKGLSNCQRKERHLASQPHVTVM